MCHSATFCLSSGRGVAVVACGSVVGWKGVFLRALLSQRTPRKNRSPVRKRKSRPKYRRDGMVTLSIDKNDEHRRNI